MRNLLYAATALGFAALAPTANAGLVAEYSINGGSTWIPLCSDVSGGSCSRTFTATDGLTITGFAATSNSPGTALDANLLQSTARLQNPTGTNETIELRVGDIGYTMPITPPAVNLINSIAGTVVTGGAANAFSGFACVDQTNSQNLCPGGIQTPTISEPITAPGSGNKSENMLISSLHAPYAMTELLTFTLAPSANINFSASTDVVPTPEPASLALLGVGLLGVGFVASRKRS
jgi:hypothetical protein